MQAAGGVIHEEPVTVLVRFKTSMSEFILRKEKWYPSEKRKKLSNGDVELSFTVAGVNEIKHWIHSWLPSVEVVKPAWLRKQVKKELSLSIKEHS